MSKEITGKRLLGLGFNRNQMNTGPANRYKIRILSDGIIWWEKEYGVMVDLFMTHRSESVSLPHIKTVEQVKKLYHSLTGKHLKENE